MESRQFTYLVEVLFASLVDTALRIRRTAKRLGILWLIRGSTSIRVCGLESTLEDLASMIMGGMIAGVFFAGLHSSLSLVVW